MNKNEAHILEFSTSFHHDDGDDNDDDDDYDHVDEWDLKICLSFPGDP